MLVAVGGAGLRSLRVGSKHGGAAGIKVFPADVCQPHGLGAVWHLGIPARFLCSLRVKCRRQVTHDDG